MLAYAGVCWRLLAYATGIEGVLKIAEAVEVSTSLGVLSLANAVKSVAGGVSFKNQVDATGAAVLAQAIAQSYTLTKLDLSGCEIGVRFTSTKILALPVQKSLLTRTKILD